MPARRDRGQRKAHQKKALEGIRRLLHMASRQTPKRALYLKEIDTLEAEAPPAWRDMIATDDPQLVPLLRQHDLARIRFLLDRASNQTPDDAKVFLREIVTLAEKGAAPPGWRDMVETEYPQLVPLLDSVFQYDVYGEPRKPVRSGHNRRLTQEQSKLITDHLPLVRKLACQRASQINNLA